MVYTLPLSSIVAWLSHCFPLHLEPLFQNVTLLFVNGQSFFFLQPVALFQKQITPVQYTRSVILLLLDSWSGGVLPPFPWKRTTVKIFCFQKDGGAARACTSSLLSCMATSRIQLMSLGTFLNLNSDKFTSVNSAGVFVRRSLWPHRLL